MPKRKANHPPTDHHNYLDKIAALEAGGAFPPGWVGRVDVRHDDWCDCDRGFCNCDPYIEIVPGVEAMVDGLNSQGVRG